MRADGCRFSAESVRERRGNVSAFVSNAGGGKTTKHPADSDPRGLSAHTLFHSSPLFILLRYNSALISHRLVLIKFSLIPPPLQSTDSALTLSSLCNTNSMISLLQQLLQSPGRLLHKKYTTEHYNCDQHPFSCVKKTP